MFEETAHVCGVCTQDALGRICLDILKDKWSPALQIRTVLLSVQALLSAPEPDDPLDTRVADHFLHDRQAAEDRGEAGEKENTIGLSPLLREKAKALYFPVNCAAQRGSGETCTPAKPPLSSSEETLLTVFVES